VFRFIFSSPTSAPFSPALEDAYQADLAGDKIRMLYVASILCSVLFLCFGLLDLVVLPSNVTGASTVRAIVVLATLAVTAAVRYRPEVFLRHYTACMCTIALTWTAGIEAIIMLSSPTRTLPGARITPAC
jgi:hypothetical protein